MSEMKKTRMLVLGGYLGAGKTTLAVNLAKELYLRHKRTVAIITNDQGNVLVDTEYSKGAGLDTREISGGCFCTNFDNLVCNARDLVVTGKPDVIIAEPIGTSTNIMSSVVAPMRSLYPDEFSVMPFTVVVDCVRALDILNGEKEKTEDTVDLIPAHQIREAELIILTKTDMVDEDTEIKVTARLKEILPDARLIPTSSTDLRNMDEIMDLILSDAVSAKTPINEKNPGFAFEKAKLGWYSGTFEMVPSDSIDMYSMCTYLLKGVAEEYGADSVVHVKVVIEAPDAAVKMSLVQKDMQVDNIHGSRYVREKGMLILNARVISPPKRLEETMRGLIDGARREYDCTLEVIGEKCFMPKPESPSHFFFE